MNELTKIRMIISIVCREYDIPYEFIAPIIEQAIRSNPQKIISLYKQIEQIVKMP